MFDRRYIIEEKRSRPCSIEEVKQAISEEHGDQVEFATEDDDVFGEGVEVIYGFVTCRNQIDYGITEVGVR